MLRYVVKVWSVPHDIADADDRGSGDNNVAQTPLRIRATLLVAAALRRPNSSPTKPVPPNQSYQTRTVVTRPHNLPADA